jgi:hypothetical protein
MEEKMRKIIFCVLLVVVRFSFLFADDGGKNIENTTTERRYMLGGGYTWVNNPRLIGGHFDFGIVLYKKAIHIQNDILLRAGGVSPGNSNYSIFTISDKIIFGRNSREHVYTYLEGGVGIYGNDTKAFFDDPFAVSFGFGGGCDFTSDFGGVYFEVGYLGQKIDSKYPVSGVIIQTGWRIFF